MRQKIAIFSKSFRSSFFSMFSFPSASAQIVPCSAHEPALPKGEGKLLKTKTTDTINEECYDVDEDSDERPGCKEELAKDDSASNVKSVRGRRKTLTRSTIIKTK